MRWRYALAAVVTLMACGCFDSGHSSAPASSAHTNGSDAVIFLFPFTGTVDLAGGPLLPKGAPPRPADHQHFLVIRHGHTIKSVVTDNRGRFTTRLPVGRYQLRAVPLLLVTPLHFLVGATHDHHRFWMSVR